MTDVETRDGLTVGQRYALTVGSAEVTGFYAEEGIEKIRAIVTPLSSTDGSTLLTDSGQSILSTSIERFKTWIAEYQADQQSRALLETKRQRRRL